MAVVEPGGAQPLDESVAAFEVHGESAADGGVTERRGEEGLADADGAHDHGVVAGLDEAQSTVRSTRSPHGRRGNSGQLRTTTDNWGQPGTIRHDPCFTKSQTQERGGAVLEGSERVPAT